MPDTRAKSSKSAKVTKVAKWSATAMEVETPYERLYRKVQENLTAKEADK